MICHVPQYHSPLKKRYVRTIPDLVLDNGDFDVGCGVTGRRIYVMFWFGCRCGSVPVLFVVCLYSGCLPSRKPWSEPRGHARKPFNQLHWVIFAYD